VTTSYERPILEAFFVDIAVEGGHHPSIRGSDGSAFSDACRIAWPDLAILKSVSMRQNRNCLQGHK
jgi:hypothetical protein